MTSDVLKGLQQLKEQRGNEGKAKKEKTVQAPVAEAVSEPLVRGEEKTLAGRVPLGLHRRFSRLLLDTADDLGVNRVYSDEALEAALLALLDDDSVRDIWMQKLSEVRQARRGR